MSPVSNFEIRVVPSIQSISEEDWNQILPSDAGPFLQHAFLSLLEETACVTKEVGWQPSHLVLYSIADEKLLGVVPLYLKTHSYGEYVFDWSWAEAYAMNGLNYYPKALSAIPFTPAAGSRILAKSVEYQEYLVNGLLQLLNQLNISSAHVLFPQSKDAELLDKAKFLRRESIQFHWKNHQFSNFDQFLASLTMKRRKNIKRERQQVQDAGISFLHVPGRQMTEERVLFFYRCYAATYQERQSTPYLNQLFFQKWVEAMPDSLHFIFAQKDNQSIAAALLVVDKAEQKAYGRYWGALEHHSCLHFETAFYQSIEYCIANQIQILEGGAQGEHKMARGFMPQTLCSYHYLTNPSFAEAVERFLERERIGISAYRDDLAGRSPLRHGYSD